MGKNVQRIGLVFLSMLFFAFATPVISAVATVLPLFFLAVGLLYAPAQGHPVLTSWLALTAVPGALAGLAFAVSLLVMNPGRRASKTPARQLGALMCGLALFLWLSSEQTISANSQYQPPHIAMA